MCPSRRGSWRWDVDAGSRWLHSRDCARRRGWSGTAGSPVPIELFQADARALPFPDDCFDVVIDFGTCYHVSRAGRAVSEIARVLRPGGRFLTETRMSQALAHPIRTSGRGLPWSAAPELVRTRTAVLWSSQRKAG